MIRRATLEDVATIVELGRLMHAESPRWRRLSYSPAKVAMMMEALIGSPLGFVAVAVRGEQIVGAAAAIIAEEWCSWDSVANEIAVYVEASHRGALMAARLISAMDDWAREHGEAKGLQAGATTGVEIERTAQLYERLGFIRCAVGLERFYH